MCTDSASPSCLPVTSLLRSCINHRVSQLSPSSAHSCIWRAGAEQGIAHPAWALGVGLRGHNHKNAVCYGTVTKASGELT